MQFVPPQSRPNPFGGAPANRVVGQLPMEPRPPFSGPVVREPEPGKETEHEENWLSRFLIHSDLGKAFLAAGSALLLFPFLWLLTGFLEDAIFLTVSIASVPFIVLWVMTTLTMLMSLLTELKRRFVAFVEIVVDRDLDASGSIGDVGNGVVQMDYERFQKHFEEFTQRASIIGIARSAWLKADGASETYRFSDGLQITRKEYEAFIKLLRVIGRRRGRTGQLILDGKLDESEIEEETG